MPRVQLSTKKTSGKSPVTVKQAKPASAKPASAKPASAAKTATTKKVTQTPAAGVLGKAPLKGLSLKQLYSATPPLMKNNARDVIIRRIGHKKTKLGMPAIIAKAQSVSRGKKLLFETVIIGMEDDVPLYRQKRVKISCSCENHTFMWEYALTHWGASWIKYSNGEPPQVTNPGLHPGMCKHLAALTKLIMEQKI